MEWNEGREEKKIFKFLQKIQLTLQSHGNRQILPRSSGLSFRQLHVIKWNPYRKKEAIDARTVKSASQLEPSFFNTLRARLRDIAARIVRSQTGLLTRFPTRSNISGKLREMEGRARSKR